MKRDIINDISHFVYIATVCGGLRHQKIFLGGN
jgi:hypothetical protein